MAAADSTHLSHLAEVYSGRDYPLYEALAESGDTTGPQLLHQLAGEMLTPTSRILDAGCRDARHLVLLAQRHGCGGVALDPLQRHVNLAAETVASAGLGGRIGVERGVIERLPHRDGYFDFIWCRDVLTLVEDLDGAFTEFARVLARSGTVLVYLNVATELLEPGEAERLNRPLGNIASSMDRGHIESAIRGAGLGVSETREIGTAWRQYEEERTRPVSDDLLKLARLRDRREAVTAEYGQDMFERAEASLHWLAYQLLGKLKPLIYVLRHPSP